MIYDELKDSSEKRIEHLDNELSKIRVVKQRHRC